MSRRPPPDLLDPLSAADRRADAWLAAHGVRWRWPLVQGAQPQPGPSRSEGEVDEVPPGGVAAAALDSQADLQLEARETLVALRAGGLIDARLRRTDAAAPPASCGDTFDDAPALPVAETAERAGCSRRTVQMAMSELFDLEDAGQQVLPCVPAVADVYEARPRPRDGA